MRLLIIILFFSLNVHGATYYFNATSGDDTRSTTQAKSQSTPWQSLAKLSSVLSTSYTSSDSFLFAGGQTFYGHIVLSSSTNIGSVTKPIYIGSYGAGKAIISGLQFLNSATWGSANSMGTYTNSTPILWESEPTVLLIDGVPQALSRFPDRDQTTQDGWLRTTACVSAARGGTTQISSTQFAAVNTDGYDWTTTGNATAATLVVYRGSHYTTGKGKLTSQAPGSYYVLKFTQGWGDPPNAGWSFFLSNNVHACNNTGEWAYGTDKKISLNLSNPSTHIVQVARYDNLFSSTGDSYIKLENLQFTGSNDYALALNNTSNITVNNCDFTNVEGIIYGNPAKNTVVTNCTSNNVLDVGIRLNSGSGGSIIQYNSFTNTGTLDWSFFHGGIQPASCIWDYNTSNLTVKNNVIYEVGFNGISLGRGDTLDVEYNVTKNVCKMVDDGGHIYIVDNSTNSNLPNVPGRKNRLIANNICDGIYTTGHYGTPDSTSGRYNNYICGLYADNYADSVRMINNTVIGVPCGLQLHHATNILVQGNNFFGCNFKGFRLNNDRVSYVRGNRLTNNNILMTATGGNPVFTEEMSTTPDSYLPTEQFFDNNKYFRPLTASTNNTGLIFNVYNGSGGHTFVQWKAAYPWDANSTITNPTGLTVTSSSNMMVVYNSGNTVINTTLNNGKWKDMNGNLFDNALSAAPGTSSMLMYVGPSSSNPPPPPPPPPLNNVLQFRKLKYKIRVQ